VGVGRLPSGTTWRHVLGLAAAAGVGFTVALFVTSLSFDTAATTDAAKVGILFGSTIAGILGFTLLRTAPAASPAGAEDEDRPVASLRTTARPAGLTSGATASAPTA